MFQETEIAGLRKELAAATSALKQLEQQHKATVLLTAEKTARRHSKSLARVRREKDELLGQVWLLDAKLELKRKVVKRLRRARHSAAAAPAKASAEPTTIRGVTLIPTFTAGPPEVPTLVTSACRRSARKPGQHFHRRVRLTRMRLIARGVAARSTDRVMDDVLQRCDLPGWTFQAHTAHSGAPSLTAMLPT